MWYHYLTLIVGLYLVGSAIYSMVSVPGTLYSRWISNAVYILIGGAIAWWSWSGISAPTVTMYAPDTGMMGGRRRYRR
jgi:hypothetical protein